jgi:hypothetical protein
MSDMVERDDDDDDYSWLRVNTRERYCLNL